MMQAALLFLPNQRNSTNLLLPETEKIPLLISLHFLKSIRSLSCPVLPMRGAGAQRAERALPPPLRALQEQLTGSHFYNPAFLNP